jgi:hypothetical protein
MVEVFGVIVKAAVLEIKRYMGWLLNILGLMEVEEK